jgi:hypothetical protein
MAGIGDIVVTAHTDDYDDDDGMVPAPVDGLPTAPGDGHATAPVDGHATASGGASPPVEDAFEDAFEDPFEGVDPAALAEMEAAAVKAAAVDEDDNVTNAYIANDPRAQGELRSAGGLEEEALVQAVQQTARGCTGHASKYVRGLRAEAGELRSTGGRKAAAVVWVVQPAARGCAEHASYVRRLRAEAGELRSGRRCKEEALVRAVWQEARGGTGHAQYYVRGLQGEAGELWSAKGLREVGQRGPALSDNACFGAQWNAGQQFSSLHFP